MSPLLALQWIFGAFASIFGLKLTAAQLGFDLTIYKPTAPPNTPQGQGGGNPAPNPPNNGSLVKDLVSNPSSMWALAALGFVSVFVIAQVRAAGGDAAAGVRGVYKEAQATTRNLADPNTQIRKRKR